MSTRSRNACTVRCTGIPKATEEEVEAVTVVVLAIVGELTAELAIVIADLASRVEALEAAD